MNAVKIVEAFWSEVWKARNPDAVDRFVVDNVVVTTGGLDVVGKDHFKDWIRHFLAKVNDFEFDSLETFQNQDGSRVASRWRVRGKNNGLFGTLPDQRAIAFTGTAIWAVREDGKLLHNWVERSFWELYQHLGSGQG